MTSLRVQFVIDGDLVDSITGGSFQTLDPRSGDKIHDVPDGSREDVDKAVESARRAFDEGPWPKMGGKVDAPHVCNAPFSLCEHAKYAWVADAFCLDLPTAPSPGLGFYICHSQACLCNCRRVESCCTSWQI